MKRFNLGCSTIKVPAIAMGCMRLLEIEKSEIAPLIKNAIDLGIDFFDHADIYGKFTCEELFGNVLADEPSLRDKMILQTKCGIVPGVMFDFSKEHIVNSVNSSLKKLRTDHLDVLVLHRPDTLVEPEEVAAAFDELLTSGKVRNFGVSNHKPMQIELLKKYVKQPLLVNQLQLSIPASTMITAGLQANMQTEGAIDRDGSVLDYSRLNDITIQAWSPFQIPGKKGVFFGNELFPELNAKMDELAEKYNVSATSIATAWILRHPANIQVISGSTKISRLKEMADACDVNLTRQEWYEIYRSAGNILP